MITDERWRELLHVRATGPGAVRQAYATRKRRSQLLSDQGTLLLVAAGQPSLDRRTLLERLVLALANPAVDGILATPDVVEELLLLGALHDKVVFGSMNHGGAFTGYDARTLVDCGLDGGAMLLEPAALQACAEAVTELAAYGLVAMLEPLRAGDSAALARAVTVASGLGTTSAHTWLKLPATDSAEVLGATTLPVVVHGDDPDAWGPVLRHDVVRGLVVGHSPLSHVEAAAKVLEAAK